MTEAIPTPAAPETEDDGKSKRLNGREYARAKTMYQSGEYSLQEISNEVGVSASALAKRFKRDGVTKGSDATRVSAAVKRAIEKTSAAQAEELAQAAHDLKMQALKAIRLFNHKAYNDVATSIRDNKPLAEKLNDLKALETASKVIGANYSTGARILGLDKEIDIGDQLPELQIQIMTENDVQELRERQEREELEAESELLDDLDLLGTDLTPGELDELDKAIDDAAEEVETV